MSSHFYIYLTSSSDETYFPNNRPGSFTAILPDPLNLEGRWEVALVQLTHPAPLNSGQVMLLCDTVGDSVIGDNKRPLLRLLTLNSKRHSVVFNQPFYKAIKHKHVTRISIDIVSYRGKSHSFGKGELWCTLHFRKCLKN